MNKEDTLTDFRQSLTYMTEMALVYLRHDLMKNKEDRDYVKVVDDELKRRIKEREGVKK